MKNHEQINLEQNFVTNYSLHFLNLHKNKLINKFWNLKLWIGWYHKKLQCFFLFLLTWNISKIPKNSVISIARYHTTLKDLLRQRGSVRIRHFFWICFQNPGMIRTSLKQHLPSTSATCFQINKSPDLNNVC